MAVVTTNSSTPLLIFRVGELLCAFPGSHVVEVTRPLAIEPLAGVPEFVRGLAILRGAPVPVVNTRRLLQQADGPAGRFVVVRAANRTVAVAVDAVLRFHRMDPNRITSLPPLVGAASEAAVTELGQVDAELLVVLQASSLLPSDFLEAIDQGAVTA